jgi:hypothetical protein
MAKMMLETPAENTNNVSEPVVTIPDEPVKTEEEKSELKSALAMGLPESWSIEPPAVVVRRKARAI